MFVCLKKKNEKDPEKTLYKHIKIALGNNLAKGNNKESRAKLDLYT
jgi:hypothetical protein